jgi:hypothetical protein
VKIVHRLAVAIYIVSIGWFALLWLPSLLGTAGPPAWTWGRYLIAIVECQIPATIIGAVVYLVTWVTRGSLRSRRPRGLRT